MMPNVPYWDETQDTNASKWNTLILGKIVLPGIARVSLKHDNKLDVGHAQGNDGAPITNKGKQPRELTAQLWIFTPDAWSTWLGSLKKLNVGVHGQPINPFEIVHPKASEFNVRSVYIKGISSPPPDATKGMVVTIDMIENIPAKPSKQNKKSQTQAVNPNFGQSGFPPLPDGR